MSPRRVAATKLPYDTRQYVLRIASIRRVLCSWAIPPFFSFGTQGAMQTIDAVLWLVCSGEGTAIPEPLDVQWEQRVKTESVSVERSANGWCRWFRSRGQS